MKKGHGIASGVKIVEKRNPPVLSVDFDGTLCFTNVSKPYIPKTTITGKPNIDLIKMLNGMRKEGWKIIIDSSRWWGDFNWVKDWLDENEVPYDDIHLGGLKADFYINDKNLEYNILFHLNHNITFS